MKLKSKIKKIFSDELLKLIATTCDTMRINSAQHKMLIIQQLLKRNDIRFSVLGGATNRLSLYIDGCAIKIAVDNQGYVDNLIEYSIGKELQPYVTKPYETNGYILIAEAVKTLSLDDFKLRRSDIESILSILSQDYLLGDVGYVAKNYTNWGMRDDGSIVILDYAYIHRGTEKLFTCEVCGCGILRYDPTYSYLKCSNSASCTAQFTYIERKMIQGDQIDLDMIEEAKADSIIIPKGSLEKEVTDNDGKLLVGNKIITESYSEYLKYLMEVNRNMYNFDQDKALDLMIKQASSHSPEEREKLQKELDEVYKESADYDEIPEVVYEPSYADTIPYPEEDEDTDEEDIHDTSECYYDEDSIVEDIDDIFDDMVNMAKGYNIVDNNEPLDEFDSNDYVPEPEPEQEEESSTDEEEYNEFEREDEEESVQDEVQPEQEEESVQDEVQPEQEEESVQDEVQPEQEEESVQDEVQPEQEEESSTDEKESVQDESTTGVYYNGELL